MWWGWITVPESARPLLGLVLQELGVKLGVLKNDTYENCEVPDDALRYMEPLWGRIVWGLTKDKSDA